MDEIPGSVAGGVTGRLEFAPEPSSRFVLFATAELLSALGQRHKR
jgi:hypothetical protein